MGTNYYLVEVERRCGECGQHVDAKPPLHIGKASAGWHFQFNTTVHKNVKEWADALRAADKRGARITDENTTAPEAYYTLSQFFGIVAAHRSGPNCAAMTGARPGITCEDGMDCCPFEFS